MATAEPNSGLTYDQLKRIAEDNCAPFETVAQAKRFIKAANMLRLREPSEAEIGGERISRRDILDMLPAAEAAVEVLELEDPSGSRRATVIVPADCLYR